MNCRFCSSRLTDRFISLGSTPLANALLEDDSPETREASYPLDVFICKECFLVQLDEFETPEAIFGDYPYFSSFSDTWLVHVSEYAREMAAFLGLGAKHLVAEVGSNDGHLLKNFIEKAINESLVAVGK